MMRLWGAVGTLVMMCAASCALEPDEAVIPLDVDIRVGDSAVQVFARKRHNRCTCSNGEFPLPGECSTYSDGLSCDCPFGAADCIERAHIERDGVEIASSEGLAPVGFYSLSLEPGEYAAELVIDGCGSETRLPIDRTGLPIPTIEYSNLETVGWTLTVGWSSQPQAGSAMIGFSNTECHHVGAGPGELVYGPTNVGPDEVAPFSVTAFAERETIELDAGTFRMWRGSTASGEISR